MYADETLTCVACKRPFTFTVSEQEFYASKNFTNKPGRCSDCRDAGEQQTADTGVPFYARAGSCLRRRAPSAAAAQRSHSSRKMAAPYIAGTVTRCSRPTGRRITHTN